MTLLAVSSRRLATSPGSPAGHAYSGQMLDESAQIIGAGTGWVTATCVVRSGSIGHSRVMQLSDWLSILGIAMSTVTSVISIALAVHIYQEERKKASRDGEKNDRRHNQLTGFLAWLCMLVNKLVEFASQLVKDGSQQQAQRPSVSRQGGTSSPTFQTDHPADRSSRPEPGAQGPVRQLDNISGDLACRSDIARSGPDAPAQVSQEVGVARPTSRRRAVGDEEFESPTNDQSTPPRHKIRHNSQINRGVVASTVDAAALSAEPVNGTWRRNVTI